MNMLQQMYGIFGQRGSH